MYLRHMQGGEGRQQPMVQSAFEQPCRLRHVFFDFLLAESCTSSVQIFLRPRN